MKFRREKYTNMLFGIAFIFCWPFPYEYKRLFVAGLCMFNQDILFIVNKKRNANVR